MFDAAPEAIGVIDPDTLQIMEANRSLASCLGYTQKELRTLTLEKLITLDPREIQDQLLKITREDEAAKMDWRARKKDGTILDLEVIGSNDGASRQEPGAGLLPGSGSLAAAAPTAILPGTDQSPRGKSPTHKPPGRKQRPGCS